MISLDYWRCSSRHWSPSMRRPAGVPSTGRRRAPLIGPRRPASRATAARHWPTSTIDHAHRSSLDMQIRTRLRRFLAVNGPRRSSIIGRNRYHSSDISISLIGRPVPVFRRRRTARVSIHRKKLTIDIEMASFPSSYPPEGGATPLF